MNFIQKELFSLEAAIPAAYPILVALQKHLSRVAPHPGLRPRIRRDPRDPLSVMRPSIGYPAGITALEDSQHLEILSISY